MFGILTNRDLINRKEIGEFIEFYAKGDNWHKLEKYNGGLGYGWVHYGLIRLVKPERVLCIGSRYGLIPAICAMACKDNRFGMVDFVDAGYDMNDFDGPGEHWGGVGFWKNCDSKKYFGKFGLERYIKLYVMKSKDYYKVSKNNTYGYIHIDGDHSYKGVKSDFVKFWPKLDKGGFLAIHDIGSPDKDGNVYGTRDFWNEIKVAKKMRFFEFPEDPGVGIIQK